MNSSPRNKHPKEYFETAESRKVHLGGGCTFWWNMGQRRALGYREGIWSSSWYARFGYKRNKTITMRFGEPDDVMRADGVIIFSFEQAMQKALELCLEISKSPSAFISPQGKYRRLPEPPPRSPYLIIHALLDYHQRQVSLGKRINPDESVMRVSILPHLGHVELANLTSNDIRDWLETVLKAAPRLAARRPSNIHFVRRENNALYRDRRLGAANRCLRVLKAALQLAYENEHCESDAVWKRIKFYRRRPPKPPRYLERDEIRRLVEDCEPDLRCLVVAALLTGCRANELLKLRVADYHRSLKRIYVTDDKTMKARHVSLSQEGREFFDRVTSFRNPKEYLLLRKDGRPWIKGSYLYRLHRTCNRVNIVPVIGLHDLRRTFASHAVMGGVPIPVVSKQLGHAKLETTERSYLHLSQTYMDDIFSEKMPSLISGEPVWHLELE